MGVTWHRFHLVTGAETALRRVATSPRLLVGLDFDGVLSEIVDRPERAVPVDGVHAVLTELVALEGVRVAAVSGRRRDDLAARLAPPDGVLLVGEHGADRGEGRSTPHPHIAEVRSELTPVVARFPGAWVEEKLTGLTVHSRALSAPDALRLADSVEVVLSRLVPGLYERGNRVVDIRLAGVTKGDAIGGLRRPGEAVLFVGDDTTDESVFVRLGDGDLGVKVGPGESAARWRVDGPEAVVGMLRAVVDIRSASAS